MLYTGVTGKIGIKIGTATTATDVAHMSNWNLDISRNMVEVTSFGSSYKEKVPGIKDFKASSDGKVDFSVAGGQKDLLSAFENGTVVTVTFYLTTDTFFVGDAYIESLSIKDEADGAASITISLAGSGAVALTIPTT